MCSEAAAREVADGTADQAVVCCWTGTGASIAANKVPGVRAALCTDAYTADGARRWNDANVLALSLRLTSEPLLTEILDAWFAGAPSADTEDRQNWTASGCSITDGARSVAPGSQPHDDQRRVVGGAAGWQQLQQDGVGEGLGILVPMAGQGVGEAGQARVDVLAAPFDQSVGVEDEGGAGVYVVSAWGLGIGSGRASSGVSVARSRNSARPSGWIRTGGGWPALL